VICDSCAWAGFRNSVGDTTLAKALHEHGKGCECQHKTGAGWAIKKPLPPKR
jgi:hypothetical protein